MQLDFASEDISKIYRQAHLAHSPAEIVKLCHVRALLRSPVLIEFHERNPTAENAFHRMHVRTLLSSGL